MVPQRSTGRQNIPLGHLDLDSRHAPVVVASGYVHLLPEVVESCVDYPLHLLERHHHFEAGHLHHSLIPTKKPSFIRRSVTSTGGEGKSIIRCKGKTARRQAPSACSRSQSYVASTEQRVEKMR